MADSKLTNNMVYQGKHPFEIDNVVEVILGYLPIKDLICSRNINTFCNKNAAIILSQPLNQSKLKPIIIHGQINKFLKMLRNSQNLNLFRTIDLFIDEDMIEQNQNNYKLKKTLKIVKMVNPLEIVIGYDSEEKFDFTYYKFIFEILRQINSKLVKIQVKGELEKWRKVHEIWNQDINFPNLKILDVSMRAPEILVKIFTKNSPKLNHIVIRDLRDSSAYEMVPKIEKFEILGYFYHNNLQTSRELLKLTNLRLSSFKSYIQPIRDVHHECFRPDKFAQEFSNFRKFLQSQSSTLEEFEVKIFTKCWYFRAENEDRDQLRLDIPKLEKLQNFSLKYEKLEKPGEKIYWESKPEEIWPIKPINLPEIFPNLRKIYIQYHENWRGNFDLNVPCQTVKEIVLENWPLENLEEISQLFPQNEDLKFLGYFNLENEQRDERNRKLRLKLKFDLRPDRNENGIRIY